MVFGETKKSLRRRLVLWFLILSVIPVAVVSFLGYQSAHGILQKLTSEVLTEALSVKVDNIESAFGRITRDVRVQSERLDNLDFLDTLRGAYEVSGKKSVREFIQSNEWERVVKFRGMDLSIFQRQYGYEDIFLIDAEGHVLFSVGREDDLGADLFSGRYSDTRFAAACRTCIETSELVFSDFEQYKPSDGKVVGFVCAPILDETGKPVGLFAVQLGTDWIDEILYSGGGTRETEDCYLIGSDLIMRSNARRSDEPTVLQMRVDTEQSRSWFKMHSAPESPLRCDSESPRQYTGYMNHQVIGEHRTVDFAGVRMGVIMEMAEQEAFAEVARLRVAYVALLFVTVLVVVLLSASMANRIAQPLRRLAAWAAQVGRGDLSDVQIHAPEDETGVLNDTFRATVASLREEKAVREEQEWRSRGTERLNDAMRGEKSLEEFSADIAVCLAEHLDAQVVAISLVPLGGEQLIFSGGYAYVPDRAKCFRFGEGLAGQAALEKRPIVVSDVPEDPMGISGAFGTVAPRNILCFPLVYEDEVKGVIEIGSFLPFSSRNLDFMEGVARSIAMAIHSLQLRDETDRLLKEQSENGVNAPDSMVGRIEGEIK